MSLVFKAYLKLVIFEFYLRRQSFAALYKKVRSCRVQQKSSPLIATTKDICSAVDLACIWYWKQVLCLQRSAATVCLLKEYGVPARMVIGTQQMPFKAHAWVEVDGHIVNDKPYTREMYAVLESC